jgi:hypothetical protein
MGTMAQDAGCEKAGYFPTAVGWDNGGNFFVFCENPTTLQSYRQY